MWQTQEKEIPEPLRVSHITSSVQSAVVHLVNLTGLGITMETLLDIPLRVFPEMANSGLY